jgi:hypothetical protein
VSVDLALLLAMPLFIYSQIVLLNRRKFLPLAIGILLTPNVFWFLNGCRSYVAGTAFVFRNSGWDTVEYVDREYRCQHVGVGCVGRINDWMTRGANNEAVALLTHLFGPEPGAYKGPYPSQSEAEAALSITEPLSLSNIGTSTVTFDGATYSLRPKLMSELRDELEMADIDPRIHVSAALFKQECVILQIENSNHRKSLLLVNAHNGEMLAEYYLR